MCGIAGYIKKKRSVTIPYVEDVMKDTTYFNRLRGMDALGIIKVSRWLEGDKADKIETVKAVGDPYGLLLENQKFKNMFHHPGDVRYFVMHNRLATRGEKNETCAQPFAVERTDGEGEIILVHNGTLSHIYKEERFPGVTDSHQIAKMIASGMSLSEFESQIWGAFALVWYDESDGTLNLFRNADRPLGFVETEEAIFFGSESYLLSAAIVRRNAGPIKSITNTKPLDHWKYHYDDKKWETVSVPLTKKAGASHSSQISPWEGERNGGNDLTNCYPGSPIYGPHSVLLPKTGSGFGGTIVKPFVSPEYSGKPHIKPKADRNWRNSSSRQRWKSVKEALGFSTGDSVSFSVVSCRQTKRPNQLVVEGLAVNEPMESGPNKLVLLPRVYVYGMLGGTNAGDIRNKCNLYQGIIADMKMDDRSSIVTYKIMLSDIKESSQFDIFRAGHRLTKKLDIGEIEPPARASEEREFADNSEKQKAQNWIDTLLDQNGNMVGGKAPRMTTFTCNNCERVFPPAAMQPYRKRFAHDDMCVNLHICNSCNNIFVKDQTKLNDLFDFEHRRQQNLLLDSPTTPTNGVILH